MLEHRCPRCGRVFTSGPALGGHRKRCNRGEAPAIAADGSLHPALGRALDRVTANEAAVRRQLDALDGKLDGRDGLVEVALTLARALDEGAGPQTAQVAKELRATLAELEGPRSGGGDDAFADLLRSLADPMPAAVGDTAAY
jgi:hypothetical protein